MTEPEIPDDRPMTEEKWLALFRRQDVRTAKFGELLETFGDDPNCAEIIDREMGWNRDSKSPVDEFSDDDTEWDRIIAEAAEEVEAETAAAADQDTADDEEDDFDDDDLFDEDAQDREMGRSLLSAEPAYQAARDLSMFVIDRRLPQAESADGTPLGDLFADFFGNALVPMAKMRGGHSFGYDDQICANIVNNRFALEAAEASERALLELQTINGLPADFIATALPKLRELQRLLAERIADMRKRVWWTS